MLIFVHVGKCGGGTIYEELLKRHAMFQWFHMRDDTPYYPHNKYLICLRNPVDRLVSAFYWRKLELKDAEDTPEKEVLYKYSDVNDFVQDLHNVDISGIQHLKEDITFHLKWLLPHLKLEQIKMIVLHTIREDMKREFDIDITIHKHNNSKGNAKLTPENRAILKKFLDHEYRTIQKIMDMGCLTDFQYERLMQ